MALDSRGDAIAVWQTHSVIQTATKPAGGAWGAVTDLSLGMGYAPQVAVNSAGDAVAVWQSSPTTDGIDEIVWAASRPAGGAWGSPVELSAASQSRNSPHVAIDGNGDAIAAWTWSDGTDEVIQAAAKPAGGAWGSPIAISAPVSGAGEFITEPDIAVDGDGDVVAVWSRYNGTNSVVQAASKPAGGAWGAAVDLTTADQNGGNSQVAVNNTGDAVAIWQTHSGIQAASKPAGGAWGAAVDLPAPAFGQSFSEPQVAVDGAGDAVAVWTVYGTVYGINSLIQAASKPAGGAWGAAVDLTTASLGPYLPRVAVDSTGNAVAVWASYDGIGMIIEAASKPAGGAWESPVGLSVSAAGHPALEPHVAVSSAGNAVAIWQRRYSDPDEYTIEASELNRKRILTVEKSGAGSGSVTSSPPGIECGFECSAEFTEESVVALSQSAEPGSEFREWTGACSGGGSCEVMMSEAKLVGARFVHTRQVLTLSKSGSGAGTVKSKPAAVNCGVACSKAEAAIYEGALVKLTATPASGSAFAGWTGCDAVVAGECEVTMSGAKEVTATFSGSPKTIANPQAMRLAKAGAGTGSVTGGGIACEGFCTSVLAYFTKAKIITLTAKVEPGSELTWSGCDSEPEPVKCLVTMSGAREVTATFDRIPRDQVLTLSKSGSGAGTVKSKPAAVNCGVACSKAEAALYEGALVKLTATPASGSTFAEWTGCDAVVAGECEVTMSGAKEVTATFSGSPKTIANPQAMRLAKAGAGTGSVTGGGIACEGFCTSVLAYFTKAKIITLTAKVEPGSELTWSGCDSEPEPVKCLVTMSGAREVTATFEE